MGILHFIQDDYVRRGVETDGGLVFRVTDQKHSVRQNDETRRSEKSAPTNGF